MTPFVERCDRADVFFVRIVSVNGLTLAGLTRAGAEQLRDDLTAALNPAPTDSAQWEYEHGGGASRSERTTE